MIWRSRLGGTMLNNALQTIGLLGGIAGAVLVAGPTPLQRAAGFATWIAGNGAWVAFAGLTSSLYLGVQFGIFLLLSMAGLRTNLKELRVSNLVEE